MADGEACARRSPSSPEESASSSSRGATVADVLRALEREHPGTQGWILDERGAIREHINVFVNREYGREETSVAPGDRLHVLPAISGG